MFKKRIYELKRNPITKEFLINDEQFCPRCFINFGDWELAAIHRSNGNQKNSICLKPEDVGLTSYKSYGGALVWGMTDVI